MLRPAIKLTTKSQATESASLLVLAHSAVGKAQRGAGRCPEWCPGDRCGDRTTSGHVLITIERILSRQPGQG